MKLTEDQLNFVVEHLRNVAPEGFVCPICGEKHWTLNNIVCESREFIDGALFTKEKTSVMPFVTLDCDKCHNTMFLNAVALGIVTSDDKEENKKEKAQSETKSEEVSNG